MVTTKDPIATFFAGFPADVATLATSLRDFVRSTRHVQITQPSDLDRAGLADLLAAARRAAVSK